MTPCYDRRFLAVFYDELARRKRPAYPAKSWFAALAAADSLEPCNGQCQVEKRTLGARRIEEHRRWLHPEYDLMTSVARASERWLRKYARL